MNLGISWLFRMEPCFPANMALSRPFLTHDLLNRSSRVTQTLTGIRNIN